MRRNVEIWEKRHERLTAIKDRAGDNFRHAARGVTTAEHQRAVTIRRAVVESRIEEIEARVWHALCVAKEWRKA